MELLLGKAARYHTANRQAFERIPWTQEERLLISQQWEQVTDIPQSPASYYTVSYTHLDVYKRQSPFMAPLFFETMPNRETVFAILSKIVDEKVCRRRGYTEYVDCLLYTSRCV